MTLVNSSPEATDLKAALIQCLETLLADAGISSDAAEIHYGCAELAQAIIAYETDSDLAAAAQACQTIGSIFKRLNRLEEAKSWYIKAIEAQPKCLEAHLHLGQTLQELWQLAGAIDAYQRSIELDPQSAKAYYYLGLTLATQGRIDEAIANYQRSIELDPAYYWSYQRLGEALAGTGRLEEAETYYLNAIKSKPNFYLSHLYLAGVLQDQGKLKVAIVHYQKAIELNPTSFVAYHKLGTTQADLGQLEAAIGSYRQAIGLNPDFCWSHHYLGEALAAQGNWEEAESCYRRAIELNPNSFGSYAKLGDALTGGTAYRLFPWVRDSLIETGKLDQAIGCFKASAQLNLNDDWCHLQLGNALTAKGEVGEAIYHYQLACYQTNIKADPSLVHAVWNVKNLRSPDYVIIGCGKGGTTSLYDYLIKHPQILPAAQKEIDFFSHHFDCGLPWYAAQFPPALTERHLLTGEATPSYLMNPDVPQRLAALLPDIKLIVLLRNPVDRAISYYHHAVRHCQEDRSAETAILSELEALDGVDEDGLTAGERFDNVPGYVLYSLYYYALKRWLDRFDRTQILILKSEDLYSHTDSVVNQVFKFLGLSDYHLSKYPNVYPGFYRSPVPDSLRQTLSEYFKLHNQRLEDYLGVRFGWE